uniref:Neur_chan_LBD domain-containing protein n=1 Tax=Gongylonema pulchrum TaxID=637853 RepID=A0A183DCR6_9BILA
LRKRSISSFSFVFHWIFTSVSFRFRQRRCLKISRSSPICGTGRNSVPREQLNENTAFVDASPLYGSSSKDLHKFRDGRTGFLRMNRFNNQLVLPFDQSKCRSPAKCTATFTAGDIRVNLFIGLSSMHILFTREHN